VWGAPIELSKSTITISIHTHLRTEAFAPMNVQKTFDMLRDCNSHNTAKYLKELRACAAAKNSFEFLVAKELATHARCGHFSHLQGPIHGHQWVDKINGHTLVDIVKQVIRHSHHDRTDVEAAIITVQSRRTLLRLHQPVPGMSVPSLTDSKVSVLSDHGDEQPTTVIAPYRHACPKPITTGLV
jgi:hypothetical protein